MNKAAQRVCAHSAILYVLMIASGLFFIPGWLPPPSPAMPKSDVAAMFQDNLPLRIGMVITIAGSMLMLGLPAAISAQMRRIEGEGHVYADVQFGMVIIAAMTVLFSGFLWTALSWRPDINPDLAVVFNDIGWFIIISDGPPVIVQGIVIGLCILGAKDETVYPRWVGYFNFFIALLTVAGMGSFFFKTGPLAWDGLIAFWLPIPFYFFWWVVMYVMTLKAIKAQPE